MKKLILLLLLSVSALLAKAQFCGPYTFINHLSYSGMSNLTISFDSLQYISLTSCHNIHITHCKVAGNVFGIGIELNSCTGITIDSTEITNCGQGIIMTNVSSYNISHNYFLNIIGTPGDTWHPFQARSCTGSPQIFNFNKIEEIGVPFSHDQISFFQCHGSSGHLIQCYGNTIRGGQTQMNGTGPGGRVAIPGKALNGACGIGVDIGTTYILVRQNKGINTGYAGIQIIGSGIDHVTVDSNSFYSSATNISLIGLSYQVSGATDVFIGHNYLNWLTFNNTRQNLFSSVTAPPGWTTNTANTVADPLATSTMIPNPQVASCLVPPIINISGSPFAYVYGSTIANITPVNTGGAATSYSLIGTLPSGLSFNTATGVISGTNTGIKSITSYQVIAINGSGRDTATISITVNKAVLTIVPNLAFKFQGQVNPTFTASYADFQLSDSVGSLTTPATVSTTATTVSAAGTYRLTASGAAATNYTFNYVSAPFSFVILPNTIGVVIHTPVIVLTH